MANPDHVAILLQGVEVWNKWREQHPEIQPDLADAALDNTNLKNANLHHAILVGAKLKYADLTNAGLNEADLTKADLRGAKLDEASLLKAILVEADLSREEVRWADGDAWAEGDSWGKYPSASLKKAKLKEAHLERANLAMAHLEGADFGGAHLEEAKLWDAHLVKASLAWAHLEGADLNWANLEGAALLGAHLEGADLNGADLEGADFNDAHLEGADLLGAHLEGAFLREAHLERADLRMANFSNADVTGVSFDRWGKYQGIRLEGCYGSQRFVRHAKDQDYLEELLESHPRVYKLWLRSSDCGRSFGLWAFWSLLLALGFGTLYYVLGLFSDAFHASYLGVNGKPGFWALQYYSVVTFTTLGFGDIVPKTGLAAFFVTLEVIAGYVMLGGLISIFANKLARRGG